MTAPPAGEMQVPQRSAYFFLSYAHSAPSTGESADTDHWVRVCYRDLTERVRRYARPSAGLSAGFIDDLIRTGSDWNAALGDALSVAEVFVALYSPGYFNKAWPLRERESFARRLRHIEGAPDKHRHILPVLWIPVFSWQSNADIREALRLGEDVPAYLENGLRALCMLPTYRSEYEVILDRMARRIVEVAENSPVGPSWAPPPEDLPGTPAAQTQFVVAVAAPEGVDQWRPFGNGQTLPLAQYVAHTAERLGLPSRTVSLADDPRVGGQSAAVVLIDPGVVADPAARDSLAATVRALPEWVLSVVVSSRADDRYAERGGELARLAAGLLGTPAPLPIMLADDLRQFVDQVPMLVTEARRRFLRLGPTFTPKDSTTGGQPWHVPPQKRKHDT
ncbi:MAG: TIR-like protein FxsC [Actinoplanes sp.]